jgi:hypothetical protein
MTSCGGASPSGSAPWAGGRWSFMVCMVMGGPFCGPPAVAARAAFALRASASQAATANQHRGRITTTTHTSSDRTISVEVFDPPIFAALCSPNLIVAAERIAQYKQLIGPLRLNVTQGPAGTTLTLAWPVLHDPPQVLAISELVF